jgi:hypothetical protein
MFTRWAFKMDPPIAIMIAVNLSKGKLDTTDLVPRFAMKRID